MAYPNVCTKKYIPVKSDVFNINIRIKQIDSSYFILWNRISQKFEIHSKEQKGGSFCLELPFNCLDARTLEYVRKYRSQNAKEIFAEIDKENEHLNRIRENETGEMLEEMRRMIL